jgi:oxaloacetate decarboxylase beta subunit
MMKSVKFYFSLLLSAVMLSVAMPAMAQDEAAAEAQAAIEASAETAEAEAIAVVDEGAEAAVAAAVQGTQGRDNSSIDEEFSVGNAISKFVDQAGFNGFLKGDNWKCAVMLLISFLLLYLAIVKQFEPLLLMPIAFGMLLTNLPGAGMFHSEFFAGGHVHWGDFALGSAGLLDYLYLGVKLGIYPCLIFVGVGAMTDFAPLIANPKSLLLGAAAQIGIFATFLGALALGFNYWESGSIGIIGGADGPTAIYLTSKLAPHLLGPIAVAAYSYMALVPVIQPPIMKLLTTEKERKIEMKQLRSVSQREKIVFPIVITVIIALLLPSAAPLIGCLMLGNLMKECGVTERLSKTVQNELMNIVTIFLGISVGATATAEAFLNWQTLGILTLGIVAFSFGSASGVILAKTMNLFTKEKINPLIGSAGVSAVPMAARVSQSVGQKYNPGNFLLMHAMGPNVAGVIGSAVAAGILLAFLPI